MTDGVPALIFWAPVSDFPRSLTPGASDIQMNDSVETTKVYSNPAKGWGLVGMYAGIILIGMYALFVAIPATEFSIGLVILVGVMSLLLLNVLAIVPILWRYAHRVQLTDAELVAWNAFGRRQSIRYDEILGIVEDLKGRGTIRVTGAWATIVYGPPVQGLGELTENLLSKSLNCLSISLREMPQNREAWQKEPNWSVIQSAMTRAAENERNKKGGDR